MYQNGGFYSFLDCITVVVSGVRGAVACGHQWWEEHKRQPGVTTVITMIIRGRLKTRDLTSRDHQNCGDWHRETGQRGTRLNRSQRVEHPSAQEKMKVLNDKRIKSCLSRFDSCAYSRLQFLRAVSHSVGAHTESLQPWVDNSSNRNSSEDENENRQAPVPAATTSGASEAATAAAATTSDDCCEVCIVAPRAGFALVPCGHRTRRQYTRRHNDDKENFEKFIYQSITQSITILYCAQTLSRELANLVCRT